MKSPLLLTGIGLRAQHHTAFLEHLPNVAWVEVHAENFFAEGGKTLQILDQVTTLYPVSLHGVGLSLGSADALNWAHLKKLRDLSLRINPCLISEHLSWSSINGHHLHDLLPLPYTEEALTHLIGRIEQAQNYLNKQILIENISSYIQFSESTIPEHEFLVEIARRSGCGILLDINNIYVSATNLGFNPNTYLSAIPAELIHEIHLAGFTTSRINQREILIDSHSQPIVPAVWDLYRLAIQRVGTKPTIIEWDNDLPSLETLYLEAYRADKIQRDCYATTKLTS